MSTELPAIDKAYAYATREMAESSDFELLVFEQPAAETGVQIPKGTVDEGEHPREAVVRELEEETGLSDPLAVTHLETDRWHHERRDVIYRRHFFHVPVDIDRNRWDHAVTGSGEDDGMTFSCYWACPRSVSLTANMDEYLPLLLE